MEQNIKGNFMWGTITTLGIGNLKICMRNFWSYTDWSSSHVFWSRNVYK